jgi:hypothetical protein
MISVKCLLILHKNFYIKLDFIIKLENRIIISKYSLIIAKYTSIIWSLCLLNLFPLK